MVKPDDWIRIGMINGELVEVTENVVDFEVTVDSSLKGTEPGLPETDSEGSEEDQK